MGALMTMASKLGRSSNTLPKLAMSRGASGEKVAPATLALATSHWPALGVTPATSL